MSDSDQEENSQSLGRKIASGMFSAVAIINDALGRFFNLVNAVQFRGGIWPAASVIVAEDKGKAIAGVAASVFLALIPPVGVVAGLAIVLVSDPRSLLVGENSGASLTAHQGFMNCLDPVH